MLEEIAELEKNLPELEMFAIEKDLLETGHSDFGFIQENGLNRIYIKRTEAKEELDRLMKHLELSMMKYWWGYHNGFHADDQELNELRKKTEILLYNFNSLQEAMNMDKPMTWDILVHFMENKYVFV